MNHKKIIRYLFTVAVILVACCVGKLSLVQGEERGKIKTLIVDGQNNHNWRGTTAVMKKHLEDSGRFAVNVATSPTHEERDANVDKFRKDMAAFKPDFVKYDVVVMNYNGENWSKETEAAFEKYVADGGGLVIYHAANNAFPQWKEYNEMCAVGGWGGRNENSGPYLYWEDGETVRNPEPGHGGSHGPQWAFMVDVRDSQHPIMKGLPKSFRHREDELYDRLRGPAKNVTILATSFAEKEKGGSGRHEPQLMVISYGKGRVFHHCLGHDAHQCESPSFTLPLLRGAEWAATGTVTIPVPKDFGSKN